MKKITFAIIGIFALINFNFVAAATAKTSSVTKIYQTKDYEGFKAFFAGKSILQKINTKEKFEKYVDMRNAYNNGDTDTYKRLKTELDLMPKTQETKLSPKVVKTNVVVKKVIKKVPAKTTAAKKTVAKKSSKKATVKKTAAKKATVKKVSKKK